MNPTPNMAQALQTQFTLERQNEQYYRHLAAAADQASRPGATAFFTRCADEEQQHAKRVQSYMIARGLTPAFEMLEACDPIDGNNYSGLFIEAIEREQMTTAALNALWLMADDEEEDPQTVSFLTESGADGWNGFLAEQTKSEIVLLDYMIRINRLSNDGLEMFDNSLLD